MDAASGVNVDANQPAAAVQAATTRCLPDERILWQFLEGIKGWRFTGAGYMVRGPGGEDGNGGSSATEMESNQLPQFVTTHPTLMAEFTAWMRQAREARGEGVAEQLPQQEDGKKEQSGRPPAREVRQPASPRQRKAGAASSSSSSSSSAPSSSSTSVAEEPSPKASSTTVSPSPTPMPIPTASSNLDEVAAMTATPVPSLHAKAPSLHAKAPESIESPSTTDAAATGGTGSTPPSLPPNEGEAAVAMQENHVMEVESEISQQQQQQQQQQEGEGAEAAEAGAAIEQKEVEAEGGGSVAAYEQAAESESKSGTGSNKDGAAKAKGDGDDAGVEVEVEMAKVECAGMARTPDVASLSSTLAEKGGAGGAASTSVAVAGSGAALANGGGAAAKAEKGKDSQGKGVQRVPAGPCLCPRDSEGGHKTVEVERRCWPGSNKPGGTARITKKYIQKEEVFGELVDYTFYDVKYIMGGSEKGVKETFVSCTPLETAARQAAPRDIFTVEVQEPSRRQRSAPKADPPVRTSPLAPSVDTNASTSAKAKTAGGKAKAKAPKAKRPKPAVSTDGDGSGDGGRDEGGDGRGDGARGKKSKKRPRVGGGDGQVATAKAKGGGGGKKTPSSTSTKTSTSTKENRREAPMPPIVEERHSILDLSVVAETQETPAPLSAVRMAQFQAVLNKLFQESTTDTVSLAKVKADINDRLPGGAAPFPDADMNCALKFLEDVESKIMLDTDNGILYRI